MKHFLEFGSFRVDPEERVLLRGDETIPLTPKAFDLLLVLVERSGQVVTKDDLMRLLWPDTFVEESNLGQHVFQLRKALGERAQDSSYIVTVPGRGYRFAQKVRALPMGDDIVLESYSRARMIVEQKPGGGVLDQGQEIAVLPPLDLKALPPPAPTRWSRLRISSPLIAGALVGAILVWIFVRPVAMPAVARRVQLTHIGMAEPLSQALSDGTRIYFTERLGGTQSLAQVSEQGGEPSLIPTSTRDPEIFDIDRPRGRLLVASQTPNAEFQQPLWILSTSGGSARRVGDVTAGYAGISPDGRRIAYSQGTDLFVSDDDGSQARKLFSIAGMIEYIRWSPDGQRISFTVKRFSDSTLGLWEIGADGTNVGPLSFGWPEPVKRFGEGECCSDWSPDGKYFLFRSHRNDVYSIWIFRAKHAPAPGRRIVPVRLYTSPSYTTQPRFSADGRKIFFVDHLERRELVRYDAAKQLFVPYLGGIPARHLSFSRDGRWVAYRNEQDGSLWRGRTDGTQAVQLTFPPLDTFHPTWSPDGQTIAFEGSGRLYTVPRDGGKPAPLLPEGTHDLQPNWSPDGRSIVFTRLNQAQMFTTATLDLTTHQVTVLPDSDSLEDPQWSLDGKYLAAGSRKDQKLMLFDFVNRKWSPLADGLPYGWGIRWSHDSQYVYYQHPFNGEEQPIYRVRVSDRRVEQITTSRQILRADVLSYVMTGLTPDDSPLASLAHRNSDLYALELELP